jgi:hypothetical protein
MTSMALDFAKGITPSQIADLKSEMMKQGGSKPFRNQRIDILNQEGRPAAVPRLGGALRQFGARVPSVLTRTGLPPDSLYSQRVASQ